MQKAIQGVLLLQNFKDKRLVPMKVGSEAILTSKMASKKVLSLLSNPFLRHLEALEHFFLQILTL